MILYIHALSQNDFDRDKFIEGAVAGLSQLRTDGMSLTMAMFIVAV